ncbi:MAG: AAA family ATPase [Gemmatimonadetes bacterium]|nr:AAA family ATPase [Gemmatimonadota bacterium]
MNQTVVAVAPEWLQRAVAAPEQRTASSGRRGVGATGEVLSGPEEMIPDGMRNATLLSIAGTLRARGLTPAAIEAALLGINEVQCDPPLTAAEVRDVAGRSRAWAPGSLPSEPAGGRKALRFFTDAEVEDLPPPEWLIEGVLPAGGFCEIHGAPNAGKSFVCLDWSMCVQTGRPWHGRMVKQGSVAYIAAEGIGGLGKRLQSWKTAHRISGTAGMAIAGEAIQLLEPESVSELCRALVGMPEPPVLVVIDTLARCFAGGDENSSRDMGQAVRAVDEIRRTTGAAVLLVHHTRKADGVERGSGSLRGAADAMVGVTKKGDTITLTAEKMKEGPLFEPITLRLVACGESCVLESAGAAGATRSQLSERAGECLRVLPPQETSYGIWLEAFQNAGGSKGTFTRGRTELVEAGLVVKGKNGRYLRAPSESPMDGVSLSHDSTTESHWDHRAPAGLTGITTRRGDTVDLGAPARQRAPGLRGADHELE